VFSRLPRLAIVAALACSIGLHWAFLQSVAWVGMVINYSQDGTVGEALAKTFDGKHPCCLCKMIQHGRANEKKPDQQQANPALKLDLGLVWKTITFKFACEREQIPSTDSAAPSWREAPPKPPPRTA